MAVSSLLVVSLLLGLWRLSTDTGVSAQCVDGLSSGDSFPLEGADHLPYNDSIGYQVILPGLRFTCNGTVTSWSALVVSQDFTVSDSNFVVIFQVWRPAGRGRYNQVGYDVINLHASLLEPITTSYPQDSSLVYSNLTREMESRNEDNQDSEDNRPLHFQPGDIVGFYIRSRGSVKPLYITHRNATEGDSEDIVMDMYYVTRKNKPPCGMSECSQETKVIPSVIPNIFFTYDILDEIPVFLNLSAEACDEMELEECPTSQPITSPPTAVPTPSLTSTLPHSPPPTTPHPGRTFITSSIVSSPLTTVHVPNPENEGPSLLVIVIPPILAVIVVVVGGIFIVVVVLVFRERNSDKTRHTQQATNTLYSEMNGVDEPTAYASTYIVKPGVRHTYLELESSTTDAPPNFVLQTGHGSVMSVSSHHSRPPLHPSVSGPVRSGPVSMQRILSPGAMSMQIPRTGGQRERSAGHSRGTQGSLLQGAGSTCQPPGRPCNNSSRRCSVPLKNKRESQQMLLSGKSMPLIVTTSLPPPPISSPSTPHLLDPPVPYLTPEKPWYKNDCDSPNTIPVKPMPEEEGLYVPTMEERNNAGEDYSRLQQSRYSSYNGKAVFFEESDVYREPGSSATEIYQQLFNCKAREIIRKYISIHEHLGSGHFAIVHRGTWRKPGGEVEVAVKELNSSATEEDRVKFLQEAFIMSQFNHTNVVRVHGVVTINEPLMIVMELMPNGDLRNYLRTFSDRQSPEPQRSSRSASTSTPSPSPGTPTPIPPSLPAQLLSFCRQVADGMSYLSSKNFVHRDLAARNIFLTKHFACKIGDFGLARDLGGETVYKSRGGKIPIKWTAPEALQYRQFTSASDVWSYGMVLFEIWSLGHRPYDACVVDKDVMELIGGSVCQPPPPGCPRELYKLMIHCWHNDPSYRPTFSSVCEYLNQSDSNLLKLPEDLPPSISPQALELGAPLVEAKGLYLDLQYCYDESIV